jgi:Domain of unknown function (DUF5658)
MFSRYWIAGRRRGGRRDGESMRIYIDRYSLTEWSLVLALLLLSTVDLALTFAHLAGGGTEANPLMAWILHATGRLGFATAKILLTGSAALVLLLHVRFQLARHALKFLVTTYLLVMAWHALVALDRLTP